MSTVLDRSLIMTMSGFSAVIQMFGGMDPPAEVWKKVGLAFKGHFLYIFGRFAVINLRSCRILIPTLFWCFQVSPYN